MRSIASQTTIDTNAAFSASAHWPPSWARPAVMRSSTPPSIRRARMAAMTAPRTTARIELEAEGQVDIAHVRVVFAAAIGGVFKELAFEHRRRARFQS